MKLRRIFAAFLVLTLLTFPILAQQGKFKELKSELTGGTTPQYQIFDIGVVQSGDTASQGFGVSTGGVAVGRSFRSGATQAFSWTQSGGIVGLPNLTARNFCVSNSANDTGTVVGTCATTTFGSGRLPTIWQNGVVSQLPLPTGQTLGDANDVNASGVVVGSVNGGSSQRAVYYSGGTATVITQTTSGGSFFTTAFGINDSGRVVGPGIDPSNAARNVGMVYDIGNSSAIEVGALPERNGALAFGVSNAGHVVGSSMQNQGSGLPFIWTQAGGMVAIPLPTGTTQGSARSVNSSGWAVGSASSNFSIPFLYNGTETFRLQDLIPAGSGWDLSMNTSSSALGISDNGVIVGTGVLNGQTHAYAMVPMSNTLNTTTMDFDGDGKSDLSIIRPSNGGTSQWWIQKSENNSVQITDWGLDSDAMTPADFDGDGKTDIAVWRSAPATQARFFILNSSDNTFRQESFGQTGDQPIVGDFDGDGKADPAVFRATQGSFYFRGSQNNGSGNVTFIQWGANGDKSVAGDYNGDGRSDFAVFRNGTWWILYNGSSNYEARSFGLSTDKIVPGDYDGDGKTDIAVFRPSNGVWYIQNSSDNSVSYVNWGLQTDVPVPADFDGDGKADISVYRNGVWYILQSSNGNLKVENFGASTDIPVPSLN